MKKRLEEYEALSTKAMNEMNDKEKIIQESEKEKIIQEQAKPIEEKERRVAVMHYVPKIMKLCQLQKSLRRKC